MRFVYNIENGLHGFVVGDALRIIALYNPSQFVGSLNRFLLNDFVVLNDVEYNFWGYYTESANFFIREKAICNLDNTFLYNLL